MTKMKMKIIQEALVTEAKISIELHLDKIMMTKMKTKMKATHDAVEVANNTKMLVVWELLHAGEEATKMTKKKMMKMKAILDAAEVVNNTKMLVAWELLLAGAEATKMTKMKMMKMMTEKKEEAKEEEKLWLLDMALNSTKKLAEEAVKRVVKIDNNI